MTRYGFDFSRGGFPTPEHIRAAGGDFVIRYSVDDVSPVDRGLAPGEYRRYRDAGIDLVLVWESTIGRMREGHDAGAADARNAEANRTADGVPGEPAIYFAFDDDATEEDQIAINAYLDGVASVITLARTGIYGGYWPVMRAITAGKARWAWQTRAWSGTNVFPGNHLLQYPYFPADDPRNTVVIDGVACDLVQAFRDDFGQVSKHDGSAPFDPALVWRHTAGPVGQLWAVESARRKSYGRPDKSLWGRDDGHGGRLYRFDDGLVIRYETTTHQAEVV